MRYYSAKGIIVLALIGFLLGMFVISISGRVYVISPLLMLVIAYLIWTWFDTYYVIENNKLLYKSALLKGSINIDTIFEIVKNKTQCSGIKPSLSTKGLIIKYNVWDDIYLSPKYADQL